MIELCGYLFIWAFWFLILDWAKYPQLAVIIFSLILSVVTGPIFLYLLDEFCDWFFGEFLD